MRTVVVLALVGCGGSIDPVADRVFDPCAQIAISVDADDARAASVDRAISSWRDVGLLGETVRAPGGIQIVFEEAAPNIHGGYDDEQAIVYLNLALADDEIAVVAAHELGHAIGLPHIDDRPSVMTRGNLVTPPMPDDRAAVEAIWGSCSGSPRPEARGPSRPSPVSP